MLNNAAVQPPPTADGGTPTPAPQHDYLQIAQQAFEGSTSYFDAGIRAQIEAALRLFNSQHPAGSKYHSEAFKAKSKVFRPKTRTAIRHHEATAAEAFFAHDDVIAVDAENEDEQIQVVTAEVHKYLLDYRLKKSIPWFQTVIGAYQDAMSVGVVVSHQAWKYDGDRGIDQPFVDLIPIENVRFDPGADWRDPVNTSPYWIHMIPMYVKDVRGMMVKGKWKTLTDNDILTAINQQGDSIRQAREGTQRQDSKEPATGITPFSLVWVHRNIVDMGDGDVVYHTLGTLHQLDTPMPLDKFVWHGRRPYTCGSCVIQTHTPYPLGVAGLGKEINGEINEVANARLTNWLYAMNRRYFVKRNSGQVDTRSLQRNSPGGITLMNDPEKDVKVIDTQDVTGSASQEHDRLNAEFDDLTGAFSTGSVDSNRRLNETVGGMNILATTSNQVSTYQLLTFIETWVEPTLRQLHLLELHYETDDVALALAGDKAKVAAKLGQDTMVDSLLDREMVVSVNVGMGATNPHLKVDNLLAGLGKFKDILADGTLDRYGADVREIANVLFAGLGFRSGKRFFRWGAEDPSLLAARAQIQALQDALDKKLPPELLAAQVAKLGSESRTIDAKTAETVMRAIFAALQSGELVAAIPQIAPVADALLGVAAKGTEALGSGPVPELPGAGAIGIQPVKDRRTGLSYTPGSAGAGQVIDVAAGDTTPSTPAAPAVPASPGAGANRGIETMRADSA